MNDSPVLDELECQLARALHAKADQLVVDDTGFAPDAPPALDTLAPVRAARPRRRQLLAAAAAVLVVALAVTAVGLGLRAGEPGGPDAVAATGGSFTQRTEGTAGFVPAALPEGWSLQEMVVGGSGPPVHDLRQLFGGPESPMARGAVVGSVRTEGRVVEDATHTIQGRRARVGPSPDPSSPTGELAATWIDGDVTHDVRAVGMDEAELVAFLDTLVPRSDPADGFDAPPGSALPAVAETTVENHFTTTVTYADPAGGTVSVVAAESDYWGGLVHRLEGTPGPNGFVLRGTVSDEPDSPMFVSVARPDGWTVQVTQDAAGARRNPGLVDEVLSSVVPVTTQQLVDIGVAQPVTATYAVGGWTVAVHGTPTEAVAACLTAGGGPTVCTSAETVSWSHLVSASALIEGRWIVVAVTEGDEVEITTTELVPMGQIDPVDLSAGAERDTTGATLAQVVTVPNDAEAVQVMVPTVNGQSIGFVYERPGT